MALRRFWIEKEQRQNDLVLLQGDHFHHVRDVCRFGVGDRFEVLQGDGKAYLVELIEMNKKTATGRIVDERSLPEPPRPYIHLCLSVPKFPKVDWIIEKGVELGVKKITPFLSDFSFVRSAKDVSLNRYQRWENIIHKATEQSGRGDLMELGRLRKLEDLVQEFNRTSGVAGLFPFEGDAQASWTELIPRLKGKDLREIWVFVGSEGGFSHAEVELFQQAKLEPMTMGEQILRVETACVALMSVIKYELAGR